MSKNITIQEGSIAKQMTADKLKTNLVGGGACLWVPEDEVSLGTKHITENGTYTASEDGKYGYSQVTVNVPGGAGGSPGSVGSSIAGTNPTTGNEVIQTVDNDGMIQTTQIPSFINVISPPTVIAYTNGSRIDFSGMIIKAYNNDGTLWTDTDHPDGVISESELTLSVTTANIDSASQEIWTDGNGINAKKYTLVTTNDIKNFWGQIGGFRSLDVIGVDEYGQNVTIGNHFSTDERDAVINMEVMATIYNNNIYITYISGDQHKYAVLYLNNNGYWERYGSSTIGRYDGSFNTLNNDRNIEWSGVPISTVNPYNKNINELYPTRNTQEIPVKWNRIGDNKELETSFEITVTATSGSENSGSENSGSENSGSENSGSENSGGGGGGHSF